MLLPDSNLDLWAKEQGYRCVIGVDEAGRGPWAGPVVVAAVALKPTEIRFYDSKQISEKNREKLFARVHSEALAVSVQSASSERIDEINILRATLEAMSRAVLAVLQLVPDADCVIVDGTHTLPNLPIPCVAFPRADARAQSVAAASIAAKVTRDRYMIDLDTQYPQYQFAKHKGYGTALHQKLLLANGPCPEHRRSFAPIKEALGSKPAQNNLFAKDNKTK